MLTQQPGSFYISPVFNKAGLIFYMDSSAVKQPIKKPAHIHSPAGLFKIFLISKLL